MQTYRILKTLPIAEGTVLQLTEAQAQVRRHQLAPLGKGGFRTTAAVQFKVGEVLGIEGALSKVHQEYVSALDQEKKVEKKSEKA